MKVCEIIAKELDVPVENILGLAAAESQYGTGRIAGDIIITFLSVLLHHFSQVGFIQRIVTKLGWLFFLRFQFVRDLLLSSMVTLFGEKDALVFSEALVAAGFNSGSHITGGTDNYAGITAGIIIMVGRRIACPVK